MSQAQIDSFIVECQIPVVAGVMREQFLIRGRVFNRGVEKRAEVVGFKGSASRA